MYCKTISSTLMLVYTCTTTTLLFLHHVHCSDMMVGDRSVLDMKLRERLLSTTSPQLVPVRNTRVSVNVSAGVELKKIVQLDELHNSLTVR